MKREADETVEETRSRIMRSVRREGTKPEMALRRRLHAMGYRYRVNVKQLPGSPDLVFSARNKIIFVHGCFWHRHENCRYATMPKSRTEFWETKFAANVLRDRKNISELRSLGWAVLVVWECELRSTEFQIELVVNFLGPSLSRSAVARRK